jgi:hypothetical protein
MKVQIENNIFLESDGMQFIIKEYIGRQDKDGNERFKVHGYFPSIKSALHKLIKMKIMQSTVSTLKELVSEIENIKQFIESQLSV